MALANRVRFEQKYSRRRFSRRDSTNAGNFFRTNSEMLAAFVRELCPCLLILMDAVTKEKRDSPPPQTSSSRVWNVFARDISSQTAENASLRIGCFNAEQFDVRLSSCSSSSSRWRALEHSCNVHRTTYSRPSASRQFLTFPAGMAYLVRRYPPSSGLTILPS